MNQTKSKTGCISKRIAALMASALATLLLSANVQAAVSGITGTSAPKTFNLTASAGSSSQPDGAFIYSWGYGCTSTPLAARFLPANPAANCPLMQLPGPTLIVTEGDAVTVTLTNGLPPAAGNTSIVFPGMSVSASGGVPGLLAQEAANGTTGNTVTYTFTAGAPGTYAYYSGSQANLQIEMGLFGAIVVLPNAASVTKAACVKSTPYADATYSLAASAYGHPDSCYDREYLFQFSEMSSTIHEQVKAQVDACPVGPCSQILATMEPYRPNYYLINGRSMPDIMDISYSVSYPNQPYNGNPHMHPGELVLMRVIGQGRWQHPFHFHGNHARVLARDANIMLAQNDPQATDVIQPRLAGPLLFTIPTVSGQTVDAIFTWTGQGLNWDAYGAEPHTCNGKALPATAGDVSAQSTGFDPVSHEYCLDHGKAIPATPPDPSIVVNGQWYGGTPYIGLQSANPTPEAPGTLNQNPEAGYAYMWHSHNEREITTNDVFPGGMMMMLLIDPYGWTIDETQ
jgi:FtsP/CotA-like multicopper oxidase with cupredoxin domain